MADSRDGVKAPSIKDLDEAQRSALLAFRAQHGRQWRADLASGWARAAYPGYLQQIRNEFGPEWLYGLKDPAYQLRVVLATADGCEGVFTAALDKAAEVEQGRITWSPREPDGETVRVDIWRANGSEAEHCELDGDTWRAIEDADRDVALWSAVLLGADLEAAVQEVREEVRAGARP